MFYIKYIAVFIFLLFGANNVYAFELVRGDQALNDSISNFIDQVVNDSGNEFNQFVNAMMVAFAFFAIAWYAIKYFLQGIEVIGEVVIWLFIAFMAFAFWGTYDEAMSMAWSWSDDLATGIQNEALGTSDILFVSSRLQEQISNFFLSNVTIFDGVQAMVTVILFRFVAFILEVVLFIVSLWSVWGYGFAKITGLLFLPLVLTPATRQYFAKWFAIFLGFWFFNLFSKIVMILYYLYFGAIFGAISEPVEYEPIADQLALFRITIHFLLGIVFLLGVGKLSAAMAGAVSGGGSSAGIAMMITRKIVTKT